MQYDFPKELNLAKEHYENGRIKEAILKYQSIVEHCNREPDVFTVEEEYHHQACKKLMACFEDPLLNLDQLREDSEPYSEDIIKTVRWYFQSYISSIQKNKDSTLAPEYKRYLALCYQLLGEFTKSIDSYDQALLSDQNCPQVYAGRSISHASISQFEEAIFDIEKALSISPENCSYLLNYAIILDLSGKKEKAISSVEKAIKLDKGSKFFRYYYAKFLLSDKRNNDALEAINSIQDGDFSEPKFYALKSSILSSLGRYKEALASIKKANNRNPQVFLFKYQEAMLHFFHEKFEEAKEEVLSLISRYPTERSLPRLYSDIENAISSKETLDSVKHAFQNFANDFPNDCNRDLIKWEVLLKNHLNSYKKVNCFLITASIIIGIVIFCSITTKTVEDWSLLSVLSTALLVLTPIYLSLDKVKKDINICISIKEDIKSKRDLYMLLFANSKQSGDSDCINSLLAYYNSNSIAKILLLKQAETSESHMSVPQKFLQIMDKPINKK